MSTKEHIYRDGVQAHTLSAALAMHGCGGYALM
jgi:hypothetical protein